MGWGRAVIVAVAATVVGAACGSSGTDANGTAAVGVSTTSIPASATTAATFPASTAPPALPPTVATVPATRVVVTNPPTTQTPVCPTAPPVLSAFATGATRTLPPDPLTGETDGYIVLTGTVTNLTDVEVSGVSVYVRVTPENTGGAITTIPGIHPHQSESFDTEVKWFGSVPQYQAYVNDYSYYECRH
jgi:hypothetical protein